MSEENTLKHLGAVQNYGVILNNIINKGANTIAPIYESGVKLVPNFAKPYITSAEEKFRQVSAPAFVNAQDTAGKLLQKADDQVNRVVTGATSLLESGKGTVDSAFSNLKEIQRHNVETYKATTQKYFQLVAGTGEWVASKVSPSQAFERSHELLRLALNKAQEATDPDVAVQIVHDAWVQFAAVPAVAKVLPLVEPAVKAGLNGFHALHNAVVSNSAYKYAFDLSSSALNWATTTSTYRLGARVLYPWVQPVADPAIKKLTESNIVNQVVDYWKPIPPIAA